MKRIKSKHFVADIGRAYWDNKNIIEIFSTWDLALAHELHVGREEIDDLIFLLRKIKQEVEK